MFRTHKNNQLILDFRYCGTEGKENFALSISPKWWKEKKGCEPRLRQIREWCTENLKGSCRSEFNFLDGKAAW